MRLVFIFLLFCTSGFSQLWLQIGDFPGIKRDDGVAVTVNNKAYFGSGLIEWAITVDFYELNLATNAWSPIAPMPHTAERQYATAFAGPDCFYVFGGEGIGGALNNLYKYDIATNTWSAAAPKPGKGLMAASCMNFGNKIIICGGKFKPSSDISNEVWEYTISSDTWLKKNNYPFIGRWRSSAVTLNGEGYLIFGKDTNGAYRKEFYKYTPASDTWTKIMDFPLPRGRAYASLDMANDELFVFGGVDTLDHFYKDIWYFKPLTNTWIQGPDLPSTGRKGGLSCAAAGNFYYSCGIGEGPVRLTETWMTDIPVGIKENTYSKNSIGVYPNPTGGKISFNLPPGFNGSSFNCSCFDLSGREIASSSDIKTGQSIDLSPFEPGIYFLKFYSENQLIETKKVIRN